MASLSAAACWFAGASDIANATASKQIGVRVVILGALAPRGKTSPPHRVSPLLVPKYPATRAPVMLHVPLFLDALTAC